MRNAVAAGQCSYTLGFYTSEDPDNKYHSIQILIDRERVHLRYRPGYWAFSDGGSGSSPQAELRVALASPFTAGSIRLQARAVRRPRSSAEVRVTVFIDSSNLSLHKEKNAWSATIDLLFGQKDAVGRVFAIAPYRVPLRISNKTHVSRVWLSTETVLLLRAQSRSMRIVVRDVNTGAIGSLDIPVNKIGLEKRQSEAWPSVDLPHPPAPAD